ncbi:ATP-dependent DNA helicase SRS2-like protein At4g25120 isoform X1 [Cryptomeria japonica]|uniref:ATP-dependent DNA helicase SRS2-like protein At4g25120 isoform X1 n=1 Tax=Cryptomeria japonica TaxID=3369 RepID=UPI0027DA4E3D|nr:ATP-dependent DNA helicase SRS2-like protein At4g25120 isoform X1 [Cryptomeria japonica]XP_057852721.2 ATP-dependent DNA helicase SRS2-like protein At4g25120 isoform X1 [Cryptomeria japonica]XP_057852722.2 ATP-dependent DNA helicase SRS2-like protein At4g25120 isoform X1 [Cryptomeria japonica]
MAPESSSLLANSSHKRINDQERARITANFRAAKALLERKRPPQPATNLAYYQTPHKKLSASPTLETTQRRSTSSSDFRNTNTTKLCDSYDLNKPPRVPLAEIQVNTMISGQFCKSDAVEFPNVEYMTLSKQTHNSAAISSVSEVNKNHKTFPSDIKSEFSERENLIWMQSSISKNFTFSSESSCESASLENSISFLDALDEEFDDAIFEEIDVLCKNRSMLKQEVVSVSPPDISRESDATMPSVRLDAASASFTNSLSLDGPIADRKDKLISMKACLAEVNFDNSSSAEISSNSSSPFVPSHAENAISAGVKIECKETHESQLEMLKLLVDTSIETGYACEASNSNEVQENSLIALNETCQLTSVHGSSTSTDSPNKSSSSAVSCVTASQTLPTYLQSLNDTQREAATSDISKPLMILAGPGSGKTSTMVARLLTLLKENVHPTNILAMTFTSAAASEMRERVGTIVGKSIAKELSICTFHSFCLQLCRLHAEKLGRTSDFLIYGHSQQRNAVIEAVRLFTIEDQTNQVTESINQGMCIDVKRNLESMKHKSKKWQQFVTQAKAAGRNPEDYERMGDKTGASILRHYNATLTACNALDYHDFISGAVKLLTNHKEVLEECHKSWTAILVDEFQDTSSMQYCFLKLLSSHNHITVVGDDDQSIFSFNGADISGFDSFRKDFPCLKEVRLHQNYRSTRCIVEAASSLIENNVKRCSSKHVFTDNVSGDKIMIKECRTEDAQCAFVVDKILMETSGNTRNEHCFDNIAILYRRQVSGKLFQSCFRTRKIPFNVHGVAFYRKKVIKAVIAMLQTAFHTFGDAPYRRVFKALYPGAKEDQKRAVDYVEKVAKSTKCGFFAAAHDIFTAKVSGMFNRRQLAQGRRVLFIIQTIQKLVHKEKSLSAVVTSAVNFIPQKFQFEKRAIVDEDGGKLLNEDEDPRSVLDYLLDDVSDFLSNHFNSLEKDGEEETKKADQEGCMKVLKNFLDYLSTREMDNFKQRRKHNQNSVTLTTMHQSKGLEWDTVFIVKANDSEIPLLHESMGSVKNGATSLEEERRLFYVAMTRARKKLYILYVVVDSNWQLLQPSRFLKELPLHLVDIEAESANSRTISESCQLAGKSNDDESLNRQEFKARKDDLASNRAVKIENNIYNQCLSSNIDEEKDSKLILLNEEFNAGNGFLKGFNFEARSTVAALFHTWAKKRAFHDPKRLLDKVGFVIDERIRSKTSKNKDVLRALKCCLKDNEAFSYAEHVLRWEKMHPDEKYLLQAERQEHFQKQGCERIMDSTAATPKQISYLQKLGCSITPTSRLHASRLIEQYKSL